MASFTISGYIPRHLELARYNDLLSDLRNKNHRKYNNMIIIIVRDCSLLFDFNEI